MSSSFFDDLWKYQNPCFDETNQSDEEDIGYANSISSPDYYDNTLDEKDEKWMNEKNVGRNTDAYLSCPCCFTLICTDCQKHETILNQYRAMFVQNCVVKKDRELKYKKELETSKRQMRKQIYKAKRQAKKIQKRGAEEQSDSLNEQAKQMFKDLDQIKSNQKPFEYCDNILVEDEHLYFPEIYFPVHCRECDIQVGILDEEELYHFFNVAPSDF